METYYIHGENWRQYHEDQAWMNKDQVWKLEGWEKSNLDEWISSLETEDQTWLNEAQVWKLEDCED